jgi:hypothetical protein
MTAENKNLRFDRDQILNRYWDLANLDADTTKGNITGQLKALDSLCEQMAATQTTKPNKTLPAVEIYRSGWRSGA